METVRLAALRPSVGTDILGKTEQQTLEARRKEALTVLGGDDGVDFFPPREALLVQAPPVPVAGADDEAEPFSTPRQSSCGDAPDAPTAVTAFDAPRSPAGSIVPRRSPPSPASTAGSSPSADRSQRQPRVLELRSRQAVGGSRLPVARCRATAESD